MYASNAHTPGLFTGFNVTSVGAINTISPMIQTVMSGMTLCSDPITLPVELLDFNGEEMNTVNTLRWATATETDNDRFELERSADGAGWELIATVEGAGNSQSTVRYEAVDPQPYDITYYRLRQVDFDGKGTLSQVIALERDAVPNALSIYPNPTGDRFTIRNDVGERIDQVDVMAADGRVVLRSSPATSSKHLEVDVSELAVGIYQLRVASNGVWRSTSLVKVHP
ncbi:MAG: T9SS type A sorting domain-containing protein [Flavobacteriales bacterium]|nr:T9SS type A sorting domain-containing protein [Flavobacteriales bacterium]